MPSITSAAVLVAVAALGIAGSPAAPAGAAPPAAVLVAAAARGLPVPPAAPAGAAPPAGVPAPPAGVTAADLRVGRQALPANDGWAAAGAGTTGGSTADDAHVTVVRNRAELV